MRIQFAYDNINSYFNRKINEVKEEYEYKKDALFKKYKNDKDEYSFKLRLLDMKKEHELELLNYQYINTFKNYNDIILKY